MSIRQPYNNLPAFSSRALSGGAGDKWINGRRELENIVFEKPAVAQTPYFSIEDLGQWLNKYDQKKELAVIIVSKADPATADLDAIEKPFKTCDFRRVIIFQGINSSGDFPVFRDSFEAKEKDNAKRKAQSPQSF